MSQRIIFNDQVWRNLGLTIIIFTLILSIFLFHYGVKIKNDEYCNSERLFNDRNTMLANNTHVLNNANDYLLQSFDWHYNVYRNVKELEFCFTGTVNLSTQQSVKLQVINSNLTVFAETYASAGYYDHCLQLSNIDSLKARDTLGVRCVNCDINNFFVPETRLLSGNTDFLFNNGGVVSSFSESRASYNSLYTLNCRPTYQKLLNAYYSVAGILFLVWLLLLGVEWLKRQLWGGWS